MESKRYKVLIADDEYWTRQKLCHMIQWEEYSLSVWNLRATGRKYCSGWRRIRRIS